MVMEWEDAMEDRPQQCMPTLLKYFGIKDVGCWRKTYVRLAAPRLAQLEQCRPCDSKTSGSNPSRSKLLCKFPVHCDESARPFLFRNCLTASNLAE